MLATRRRYRHAPELVSNPGMPFAVTTGFTTSNCTLSIVGGNLRLTVTANGAAYFYTTIACEVGRYYRYEQHIVARNLTSGALMYVGTSSGNLAATFNQNTGSATGGKYAIFKATQATHWVTFSTSSAALAGETADLALFSVKEYV